MRPIRPAPEQRVWDWLDAHAVPFRDTTAAWVDRYGARFPVGAGRRVCRQRGGASLLSGQRHEVEFETRFEVGPAASPCRLRAVADGDEADWERAIASLVPHLGVGRRASTREHRWEEGRARVALVFREASSVRTPWWRFGSGPAHSLSLWVEPGWALDLSDAEHAVLARSAPLADGSHLETPRRTWPHHTPLAFVRRRPFDAPPPGLWLDAETGQVALVGPASVAVFSSREVAAVCVDTILPAKGSGGCSLGLVLRDRLRAGAPLVAPWKTPDTVWLLGNWGTPAGTFDTAAAALADRLGVPLHEPRRYDV